MPTIDPSEQKLFDQIDNALKRLQNNVQVDMPYFLTSASKERENRVNTYNWHKDSFFEKDEEHLQYQTWYYREDAEDLCCLELHGGIEEERRRAEKAKQTTSKYQRSASISTVSSPGESYQSTPKKKISFQEYQKRKLGGGETSISPDVRVATKFAQLKSNGGQSSAKSTTDNSLDRPSFLAAELDRKRKREAAAPAKHKRVISESLPVPPKKAAPAVRSARQNMSSMFGDMMDPFDLPELLSPTFDDPKKNPPFGFPALLSPLSLPASFRRDVAAHKSQLEVDEAEQTPTSQSFPSNKGSRPRSDTKLSKGSVSNRDLEEDNATNLSAPVTSKDAVRDPVLAKHGAALSKGSLVILKFGKRRRRDLQRILDARPKPSSLPDESPARKHPVKMREDDHSSSEEEPIKSRTKATNGISKKEPIKESYPSQDPDGERPVQTKKRAREDDLPETPPNKRIHHSTAKTHTSTSDTHTPTKTEHLSPAAAHKRSESLRSQPGTALTPAKDLKSANMSRTHSAESIISTPRISGSTPGPAGKAPTSAPAVNGVGAKSNSPLKWMEREISATGKRLKTHFQEIYEKVRGGEKVTEAERKKAAISGLESVL